MPFGSYQVSDEDAIRNAVRFVKEAGVDAVKIEGAGPTLAPVGALVGAGVPVMGHLGLTPQSATMLGGYRVQGRTARRAQPLARRRARARGGRAASRSCSSACPTPWPSGSPARSRSRRSGSAPAPPATARCSSSTTCSASTRAARPRFVKRYAELGDEIARALERYAADVRSGAFPAEEHGYAMPDEELTLFRAATP